MWWASEQHVQYIQKTCDVLLLAKPPHAHTISQLFRNIIRARARNPLYNIIHTHMYLRETEHHHTFIESWLVYSFASMFVVTKCALPRILWLAPQIYTQRIWRMIHHTRASAKIYRPFSHHNISRFQCRRHTTAHRYFAVV